MNEISKRFETIAGGFTERVTMVPSASWDNPSPCEGWTARDIVRHVTEWIPAFFNANAGLSLPNSLSVDDDPVAAWSALNDALREALDDSDSVAESIDMIVTGDLLIHTWDLARATGLDETLDADEVHRMLVGVEPYDEMLRTSGHYGPRVPVADDADETSKLIAFMGRDPAR